MKTDMETENVESDKKNQYDPKKVFSLFAK